MYTSGPKKVAVFPVGAGAAPGGVGQPPKQPINQTPIFGNASTQTGSGLNLGGGIPRSPSSSSLPQPPKLPVVPNAKYGMPGMVKVPSPVPGGVPKANNVAFASGVSAPPTFTPPVQSPVAAPPASTCRFLFITLLSL